MGATPLMTVQEFMQLPEVEGQRMELIEGRVVTADQKDERGVITHEWVKSNLIALLGDWTHRHTSLKLFSGTTFQLDEQNARTSDVALMSRSRKPVDMNGLLQGAPELAIEVVSSEKAADLSAKVGLFLAHGSESVWVAYPDQKEIWIFNTSRQGRLFEENQVLEDPAVLPGFSTPVSAIFEGI